MKLNQKGQGMIEYVIIVAIVAVAAFALISTFGGQIAGLWNQTTNAVTASTPS